MTMRVAYLCEPQVGGTYTTFLYLRDELLKRNVDFRCICPFDQKAYVGSSFEKDNGVVYLDIPVDVDEATVVLRDYLIREKYDILIVLPDCYDVTPPLVTSLPKSIRCIGHLDINTRGVYRPANYLRDYFDGVITVSDRLKDDIVKYYGFDPGDICVIYHGVPILNDADVIGHADKSVIDIAWTGRVDDAHKNVFLLVDIADELRRRGRLASVRFNIVGTGRDLDRLKSRVSRKGLEGTFVFHGRIDNHQIADKLLKWDIFIFPSRYEGCGFSLLEAMAAGCVPIVSRLRGVFDWIVTEDCGYIIPTDSKSRYADTVCELITDENMRHIKADCARVRCREVFNLSRMADEHVDYFEKVLQSVARVKPTVRLYRNQSDNTAYRIRQFIPCRVKRELRKIGERMGIPL